MITKISVQTHDQLEAINVTHQLEALIQDVDDGLAFFNTPHTTAALVICEDDAALRADLLRVAENLLGPLRPFQHNRHDNPNAEAHLISSLAGASLVVAVEGGRLDLGTYQDILLLELDGPRLREIRCKVIRS